MKMTWINFAISALILSTICSAQSQEEMLEEEMPMSIMPGSCPVLNDTMHQRGEKLDLQKIHGLWKLIYESKERSESLDCISMKIDANVAGSNASQIQIFFGYKIPTPQEDPVTKETKNIILYEDGYITFNHPEQSNIGAAQKSLNEDEEIDPYKQNFQILDTDYDNFLLFYSCHEETEMTNGYGQTAEDVAELQSVETEMEFDTDFTIKRVMHQIFARVLVRTLNTEVLSNVKREHYIQLLKTIVGKPQEVEDLDYFETYQNIEHYPYCPDETVDIFSLPEAKTYQELMKEMYGDESGEPGGLADDFIENIKSGEMLVSDEDESVGQEEREDGDL